MIYMDQLRTKCQPNLDWTNIIFGHGARGVDVMAFQCVDEVLATGPHVHVAATVDNGGRWTTAT